MKSGLRNRESQDAEAERLAALQAEVEAKEKAEAEAKLKADVEAKTAAERVEASKRTKQFLNAASGTAPARKSDSEEYRERLGDMASKGLLCPVQSCRSRHTKVTKTIQRAGGVVVRYRECVACGHTFSTEEKPRS